MLKGIIKIIKNLIFNYEWRNNQITEKYYSHESVKIDKRFYFRCLFNECDLHIADYFSDAEFFECKFDLCKYFINGKHVSIKEFWSATKRDGATIAYTNQFTDPKIEEVK